MLKFAGNFDELKALISSLSYIGQWSDKQGCKQFKAQDGAILNWFTNGTLQFQGAIEKKQKMEELLSQKLGSIPEYAQLINDKVDDSSTYKDENKKVFVVHGHDDVAREQLELILHKLGLDPFVLANTGGAGLTIIEALEKEIGPSTNKPRFGIVLLTPDDMGYSAKEGINKTEPRARQNVVLEMGMLLASLERSNVAILKKGHLEVPSDAQGILYIPFNNHVRETAPKLIDRLRAAGFNLDPAAITKAST